MSELLEYRPGHDYGAGIYSISGEVRGDAVHRSEPEEVTGASGQKVEFFLEQVETTDALSKALSASADVNARYGLFSASASFDFAESISMNSYSLFFLLSVRATNSFRQMRDVRMTKDAASLWRGGKMDEFRRRYGNGYVSGMATGGLYHAILQIDNRNDEEKREIAAELSGGYQGGLQAYDAAASFNHSISKVSAKHSLKVRHLQIGGSDADVAVDASGMVTKAQGFAETVAGSGAAPFSIMVKKYATVSNVPPLPNKHDLQLARDVVAECGRLRLRYLDWLNDIAYVLGNPHQFKWSNEKKQTRELEAKADQLRDAITGLARQASICADNVSKCAMPTGPLTVALDPDAIPDRRPPAPISVHRAVIRLDGDGRARPRARRPGRPKTRSSARPKGRRANPPKRAQQPKPKSRPKPVSSGKAKPNPKTKPINN